jgi:DNA repair photolyase
VAPVIPGLSDRPEQLAAVVRACRDAGAVSVSPLLLHLRPGVRAHFLGEIARSRPELAPTYERLYVRPYAPASTQRALARQVAALLDRCS